MKSKILFIPIFLLILQTIALFIIFNILSTRGYYTDFDTEILTFSLAFIIVSTLFNFKLLDNLKASETQEQKRVS